MVLRGKMPVAATVALLLLGPTCALAGLLQNVTDSVFPRGEDLDVLPVAFGDFNSDKLTDLFVVHAKDRSKLSVLLARSQGFSLASEKYFSGLREAHEGGLTCTFDGQDIVGVAPADFDGDGGMDVAVTVRAAGKDESDRTTAVEVVVLWGHHDQNKGDHRLVCPVLAMQNHQHVRISMDAQPLVLDADGNQVADLFGQKEKSRGVWRFKKGSRINEPEFVSFEDNVTDSLYYPHSNAFVDLNADGNGDILVTGESKFHLWQSVGSRKEAFFEFHKSVEYPRCRSGDRCQFIGQSALTDFDLDGRLDIIFPACDREDCGGDDVLLFKASLVDLWREQDAKFEKVTVDMDGWTFHPTTLSEHKKGNLYLGLTPRVGDINLDGYPDIVLRMRNKKSGQEQMQLLLNVESEAPNTRGFQLQTEIMEGLQDTTLATFYDLYEDGMEDVLVVRKKDSRDSEFEIGIYTNKTKDSDANFVKVIVLSGVCYHNCQGNLIEVPYGTNAPGQTICYRTQRPSEESFVEVQACAAQLPQTAHHALQLPYTILGLGMAPNFLDFMYVNISDAAAGSRGRAWPQIIPNSQVYVIPHPPDEPRYWQAKLFITPSRAIFLTGFALVGTCFICAAIILFFHWRERREDRREKLQQPNQFHFDAM